MEVEEEAEDLGVVVADLIAAEEEAEDEVRGAGHLKI
jgi:hypothetical protein